MCNFYYMSDGYNICHENCNQRLKELVEEMNRMYEEDKSMPRKIIEHLINNTERYEFLNRNGKKITIVHVNKLLHKYTITVPVDKMPTRMVAIELKPNNNDVVEMYLDNGWQLNFEVYNSGIDDKLNINYEVQFIGIPTELVKIEYI